MKILKNNNITNVKLKKCYNIRNSGGLLYENRDRKIFR